MQKTIVEAIQVMGKEETALALSYLCEQKLGHIRQKLRREDLVLQGDQLEALEEIIRKRAQAYPLQYALGRWEFYGREFLVDERALIPRPETELLVEDACKLIENNPDHPPYKVCDLGTGTGIIALSLVYEVAEHIEKMLAIDISKDALDLARENQAYLLEKYGPPGKNPEGKSKIQWEEGDLFSQNSDFFDLIISNPPYVEESLKEDLDKDLTYEPALALFAGHDGLDIYRRLIPQAYEHLKEGGHLLMEIGAYQAESLLCLMEQAGFSKLEIKKDYAGLDRGLYGRK